MYNKITEGKFKMIVEISNKTVSAKINTMGAEITSFKRDDGFELLWQGNPEYWAGQAPVLFPIVGALRGGKVKIKGQWVAMNRHGFVRKMEFAVAEKGDDFVKMTVVSSQETKKFYPFDFEFSVTYKAVNRGVETKFTVKNCGQEPLPFVVGGHPAYNIPVDKNEVFEDYIIEFSEKENIKCTEIDLKECLIDFEKITKELNNENTIPLRHNLFYKDALVFDGLKSRTVSLKSTKSGHGVEMDISEFSMLGIWSCVNDGPYVALEPWTGCATATTEDDEFEHKKNMEFLEIGREKSYSFTTKYF